MTLVQSLTDKKSNISRQENDYMVISEKMTLLEHSVSLPIRQLQQSCQGEPLQSHAPFYILPRRNIYSGPLHMPSSFQRLRQLFYSSSQRCFSCKEAILHRSIRSVLLLKHAVSSTREIEGQINFVPFSFRRIHPLFCRVNIFF